MTMKVKKLVPEATLPAQAKDADAGYDLVAIDDGVVNGNYIEYKTGIAIELPKGYHSEIFPRSSISKTGLILANGVGLIDWSYTGEILLRFKYSRHMDPDGTIVCYKKGDKIGQLVIRKTEYVNVVEVDELHTTDRGSGGFGSTDAPKV